MLSRKAALSAGALVACLSANPALVFAQGVEVSPFAGVRFGGDFFELVAGRPVDLDISPALGVVVNVPLDHGLQVEALVTHQQASVPIPMSPIEPPARHRMTVGHAQVGGLQEMTGGRVRGFLTGLLGLTRYAGDGDSEVRFTVGAGGGVKVFPSSHVGLRLDGRLHTTFVDADARLAACGAGTCLTSIHAHVIWQAEFSAGVVLRLR